MPSAAEYAQRIQAILEGRNTVDLKRLEDAPPTLKRLTQVQKELKLLKKEIGLTIKSLKAQYTDQKMQASKNTGGKELSKILFGRRLVSRFDADQKRDIQQSQHQQLAPYEDVSRIIDRTLLDIDALKIKIEQWVIDNGQR